MKPSIAFIGLGIMGQRMIENMVTHGGFNLAQAWDPNSSSCKTLKNKYPNLILGNTPESVIFAKNIDVVYIASPPSSHKEHVLNATKAGKIIFCEKPLGINVKETERLVKIVEKSGLANAVNFPFIGSAAINLIKQKIQDKSLGCIKGVDLKLHFSSWPRNWQHSAKWLKFREEGGFIREVVSHYVYLIELLFGPSTLISKSVSYPKDKKLCETHFLAQLSTKNTNITFVGETGGVGPDQVEFTIWGSKTSYRLWDWYNLQSTKGQKWEDELKELKDPRKDCYQTSLNNLELMIKNKPHNMASLRTALSVQKIIEKILTQ